MLPWKARRFGFGAMGQVRVRAIFATAGKWGAALSRLALTRGMS